MVFGAHTFDANDAVVVHYDFLEEGGTAHLHSLFLGYPHLPLKACHLTLRFAEDHAHFFRPQPDRRTGAVQGHVAPADHGYFAAAQVGRIPQANPLKEIQAEPVVRVLVAGNVDLLGHVGSAGNQHGIVWAAIRPCGGVAFPEQSGHVIDPGIELQLHPFVEHLLDLPIHPLVRQAVRRDADPHHSTRHGQGIKDLDFMSQAHQVEPGG